jgi:putative sterol carrier protein
MTASLEDLTERIRQKASRPGVLRARVCFDFGAEGKIGVDSTRDPPQVGSEDLEADLRLLCTKDVFERILDGQADPAFAFLTGQIKIQGPMGLAMKLNAFLEE